MEISHKNKSILNSIVKKCGIKDINGIVSDGKGKYYFKDHNNKHYYADLFKKTCKQVD